MDHFQKKEKVKRITLTRELIDKGFSVKNIADYFDVGEDTVRDYIRQIKERSPESESGIIILHPKTERFENTLHSFCKKTVSASDYFKDENLRTDRVRCPICNLFVNPGNVTSINNKKICKNCFETLDAKDLNNL